MPKRYYEFRDSASSKFWEIDVTGGTVTVRFGKIGTGGQATVKKFKSPAEAKSHADKVAAAKENKGYRLDSAVASPKGKAAAKGAASKADSRAAAKPKETRTKIRIGTGRREGASFRLRKAAGWGKVRSFRLAHLLFAHGGGDREIVPITQKLEFFDEANGKELYVEFDGEIVIADKSMAKALAASDNGTDYVLEITVDGRELEAGVDYELKENRNLWVG
ncbi:MAG: hypothetical protein RIT24_2034 [Planctomycetota bacterium]|jgi:predicted DNA-binding WGR domain protein